MIKDKILKFVNNPVPNIRSSQTLYEALLTTINMDLKYNDSKYKIQSKQIAKLIMDSQLKDGGFDIGYNFSFGKNMNKKSHVESTTPEVLSIYALIKYYDVYRDETVVESIRKGINWIKWYSYRYKANYWVIPYAPCSYKEVHITNAISFTVATLVYYMNIFEDESVKAICDGMLRFMKDELIIKGNIGYWNYFDKELMKDSYYIKVDNYHIAQQLYYHLNIEKYYSSEDNKTIISFVSTYLKEKLQIDLSVPYIEVNCKCSRDIHTWGYCSMLSCALLWDDKPLAKKIRSFMIEKMVIDNHFAPIIKPSGEKVDKNYYPRSDAWILHSLSEYLICIDDKNIKELVDTGLVKLEKHKYIGYENHVLTIRKKSFNFAVGIIKKIMRLTI